MSTHISRRVFLVCVGIFRHSTTWLLLPEGLTFVVHHMQHT
ncbi:MAG: hypothetical protein RLZZ201_50, partial [Actinomycetota bacterium]